MATIGTFEFRLHIIQVKLVKKTLRSFDSKWNHFASLAIQHSMPFDAILWNSKFQISKYSRGKLSTTERRVTLAHSPGSLLSVKYYNTTTPHVRYIQGIYLRCQRKIPPAHCGTDETTDEIQSHLTYTFCPILGSFSSRQGNSIMNGYNLWTQELLIQSVKSPITGFNSCQFPVRRH